MRNAGRLMAEGGRRAVKLEGGARVASTVARLVDAGIPVMGHVGLTPQSVHTLGGYRSQGKEPAGATLARRLPRAGRGRRVRGRARVHPRRARAAISALLRSPRSASAPVRAATARCRSSTTCSAWGRLHAEAREALRGDRRADHPSGRGLRRRGARGAFPAEEQATHMDAEVLGGARGHRGRGGCRGRLRRRSRSTALMAVIERVIEQGRGRAARPRRGAPRGPHDGLRAHDGRAARRAPVARARAREADATFVVVSIFVNPTQFGPGEDFDALPPRPRRGSELLAVEGVDVVFTPSVEDMYAADASGHRRARSARRALGGAVRPGHFAGVATIVTKLLNIVRPDLAFFGEKDYQQLAIVERLAARPRSRVSASSAARSCATTTGLRCPPGTRYLSADERAARA